METSITPVLRVTGLHIEGLRALKRVDWPADGMGFGSSVPDLVMVGGVNGSGKTTLLEVIADAARVLRGDGPFAWQTDPGANLWVDFALCSRITGPLKYRILAGNKAFVDAHSTDKCAMFTRTASDWDVRYRSDLFGNLQGRMSEATFLATDLPRVAYFPTDRRLEIPNEPFKVAGEVEESGGFFFRSTPAKEWNESLGALLYGARWNDLNAKEEGHPERATHFESYARAFRALIGDSKSFVWENGKLHVRVADGGAHHPLTALGSGEKQAILLAAELYRQWRPGSLVLIDEPELHFHPSWQTALWTLLETWHAERGGQVIVTTQSTHLFRIARPGTTVLLGSGL